MNKRIILFFITVLLTGNIYPQEIKECEFAGTFYPANKAALGAAIDEFLSQVSTPQIEGQIVGLIVPHAGYIYSGKVAAFGYKILENKSFDTVIVMASAHKNYIDGIVIYPKGSFRTPLGNIDIDSIAAQEFQSLDFAKLNTDYFKNEHSIEVELPFIKKVINNPRIVPILFGKVSFEQLKQLSEKIFQLSQKKNILLIASSDLSHFHPYDEAVNLDSETLEFIKNKDTDYLWASEEYAKGRACGIYPIITLLLFSKSKNANIEILNYANSGDVTQDKNRVVGYTSAVAYISRPKTEESGAKRSLPAGGQRPQAEGIKLKNNKEDNMAEYTLNNDEKLTLLRIARSTLESYLKTGKIPETKIESVNLNEKRGAFVTLKKHRELRGCIGRIVADIPLYKVISEVAVDSAVNDPRFPPVEYNELKNIEIEISVLTPFEKINSLDETELGKHGLMIRKGFYSGLLLPQVPSEYGWDKATFLEHLCLKAGLPTLAYKDKDAVIYKFSAIVFNESELSK